MILSYHSSDQCTLHLPEIGCMSMYPVSVLLVSQYDVTCRDLICRYNSAQRRCICRAEPRSNFPKKTALPNPTRCNPGRPTLDLHEVSVPSYCIGLVGSVLVNKLPASDQLSCTAQIQDELSCCGIAYTHTSHSLPFHHHGRFFEVLRCADAAWIWRNSKPSAREAQRYRELCVESPARVYGLARHVL